MISILTTGLHLNIIKSIELNSFGKVITSLKNGKSCGIDGIANECLKQSRLIITPLLCQLFNKILKTGVFPDSWCNALIIPIHKSGKIDDPGNYRGISLLSCISKVFTKVLNDRLVSWATQNGKLFEEQGGFTKGKGTTEQIFILQSLLSKYLSKKGGRCYSVFVDFSKAFDSIPHSHMFYRMISEGIHGRTLHTLQNMYSKLKSCVLIDRLNFGDVFECRIGTRQGCMLSPFLFIFYLNEFIEMCKNESCPGLYVNDHHTDVNMLLYADDLVFVGDTVGRVQKLLNILSIYCYKWGLKVNLVKTKMMVFRNGGIVKRNEKCYFDGLQIDIVKYYKYLGVLLSSRLSWSPAQSLLSSQGSKALFLINRLNYEYEFPFNASYSIFEKCIMPVITYGSQIWGTQVHHSTEDVHVRFLKRQLGLGSTTPTVAVLGESASYPIYIRCYVNVIKFWFKILHSPANSLLRSCYDMLVEHANAGRRNWAYDVRHLLYSQGFGNIWEQQMIENEQDFLAEFNDRLQSSYVQEWNGIKSEMSKLSLYNLYKSTFVRETYLSFDIPYRLRRYLAKFRTSNVSLEIEIGRRHGVPREDRLCKLCGEYNRNFIEDEFHVLLECHSYSEIRKIYLGDVTATLFTFVSIMNSNEEKLIIALANFISSAFAIRTLKLDP